MFDLFFPLILAPETAVIASAAPPVKTIQTAQVSDASLAQSVDIPPDIRIFWPPHQPADPKAPLERQAVPEIKIPTNSISVDYQPILPLPGGLNRVPVFNSNSPEIIKQEGVLLSTFPQGEKLNPQAHLNQALEGRFDIFTHHISRPQGTPRTLYQGLIVNNPSGKTRRLRVLNGLSYLNSTDAPFRELPAFLEDPQGDIYSGPGSRLSGDLLRKKDQDIFPEFLDIPPYSTEILFNLPIPPSSARSTYLQLESDGGLYLANLAKYEVRDFVEVEVIDPNPVIPDEKTNTDSPDQGKENGEEQELSDLELLYERWGIERPTPPPPRQRTRTIRESIVRKPSLDEWRRLLTSGRLVEPRDLSPVDTTDSNRIIYGRVAGVSVGSQWKTTVSDRPDGRKLSIPDIGESVSFPISTTSTGTFDTEQVHSAPMLVRYDDTALQGHGNYLVHYDLKFPLHNPSDDSRRVALTFQTPIKQNEYSDRLTFFDNPPDRVFFRGTVRVRYKNWIGRDIEKYYHIVQHRGERGQPLVELDLIPNETREARIDFFYPPDATPPQVITVTTTENISE